MSTKKNLLHPRIKVIEYYPFSPYRVNDVIDLDEEERFKMIETKGEIIFGGLNDARQSPALFKILEWWEDRHFSELPKYLDYNNGETILMVTNWEISSTGTPIPFDVNAFPPQILAKSIPASEEQYLAFQEKIKAQKEEENKKALPPEHLLVTRILCIGGKEGEMLYPDSPFKVGDILTGDRKSEVKDQTGTPVPAFNWYEFPHLFKKLEWWEKRTKEELGQYIRSGPVVFRVCKHFASTWGSFTPYGCNVGEGKFLSYSNCYPATEEEFNDYQHKTKSNQ